MLAMIYKKKCKMSKGMQKHAKVLKNMYKYAKVYKSVHNYAKLLKVLTICKSTNCNKMCSK